MQPCEKLNDKSMIAFFLQRYAPLAGQRWKLALIDMAVLNVPPTTTYPASESENESVDKKLGTL